MKWPRLDLHVVERAPAAVGVSRAQALPAGRVLLAGLHGHPGHLQRKQTHGLSAPLRTAGKRNESSSRSCFASFIRVTQQRFTNEFVSISLQKPAKKRKYWGASHEVTLSPGCCHTMNHGQPRAWLASRRQLTRNPPDLPAQRRSRGESCVLSSLIYSLLSYTCRGGSCFREESWQGIKFIGILQVGSLFSLHVYFTTCFSFATLSPSSTSMDLAAPGTTPAWATHLSQARDARAEERGKRTREHQHRWLLQTPSRTYCVHERSLCEAEV